MGKIILDIEWDGLFFKSHMKGRVPFTWCADFRCVSRSRFWGTPLPIWASKDMKELVVISSIAQLEELTGEKVTSFCTSPSTVARILVSALELPIT